MDDVAIRVENLSKQYPFDRLRTGCIGGPQARYKTIRESLTEAVQNRDKGTRRWGDKEQGRVSSCHPLSPSPLSPSAASPSLRRVAPRLRRELSRTIHGRVGLLLEACPEPFGSFDCAQDGFGQDRLAEGLRINLPRGGHRLPPRTDRAGERLSDGAVI